MKPRLNPRRSGEHFESIAKHYLEAEGLIAVESNYSCRLGEIDLIMRAASKTIVFVEVKFRKSSIFGHPVEMVGPSKQRKIRLTAAHYLSHHPALRKLNCRFDVVGIMNKQGSSEKQIDWIKNAFF
ncbi:MAG: YraN family protein [Pseudohongiellaceae bacterium]